MGGRRSAGMQISWSFHIKGKKSREIIGTKGDRNFETTSNFHRSIMPPGTDIEREKERERESDETKVRVGVAGSSYRCKTVRRVVAIKR